MSRVAKSIINLNSVKVIEKDDNIDISGPIGNLSIKKVRGVKYIIDNGKARVEGDSAMAGTAIRLLKSAVSGVQVLFEKNIEIHGSSTKAVLKASILELSLGYSHTVSMTVPDDIKVSIVTGQKTVITIKSMSKKSLGDFITAMKLLRKSRPYADDFAIVVIGEVRELKKKGGVNG